MDAAPRELVYYHNTMGRSPFTDWMDNQDRRVRHLVWNRLKRVALGNFGDHHAEGGGVWALIFDIGPGYRVYYGLVDQKVVLLLCGGSKQRQGRDIQDARSFWEDFKAQEGQ